MVNYKKRSSQELINFIMPPNDHVIKWLDNLLKERISPLVNLHFCNSSNSWLITTHQNTNKIAIRLIPSLYQVGYNYNFPCCNLDISSIDSEKSLASTYLPAPGLISPIQILADSTTSYLLINYDVIGCIFWTITRCEEVNVPLIYLDKHGRFPAVSSHAWRNGYLQRPIADEWILILRKLVKHLFPAVSLIQKTFSITPSHDVDSPSAFCFSSPTGFIFQLLYRIIKYNDFRSLYRGPIIRNFSKNNLHVNDPFNTFSTLMDLSEDAHLKSVFYFMGGASDRNFDPGYPIFSPIIINLLKDIDARGHIIGIHPSYLSSLDSDILNKELTLLRNACFHADVKQTVNACRMHFLRFQWPHLISNLSGLNISSDSSLGYADQIGFRAGTSHDYLLFNPLTNQASTIREYPLLVMDTSLFGKKYMNLNIANALHSVNNILNQCRLVSGNFTVLFHNCSFSKKEVFRLYASMIELSKI